MKYKIYNNKKGIGVDDAVPLIIFIFVVAFGVFFFKLYEQGKSDKTIDNIQRQKNILEGHGILMDYLRIVDENGNNNADLISKSYNQKDYSNLKKDVEIYFNSKLKLDYLQEWRIELVDSGQNIFLFAQSRGYSPKMDAIYQADSVFIPVKGLKSQLITLNLFLGTG